MLHRHIGQLPLVDHHRRVKDVILITELYLPESQPNPIVIMAGGLGSRLAALTHTTPKPMLQVGGKPLIETLIVELSQQGFKTFYVSVNYKAEVITEYLQDGSKWGVNINFIREKKRLGTAGALRFLPEGIKEDIVVINGDILSKIDVRRMLLFHRRVGAAATMGVKDFDLTVPYGVVDIDDENNIVSIKEKPKSRVFINAGIYTLSPSTLSYIPEDEFFDAPSLFELCKAAGQKTCAYPLREYWIDVGHMKNFEQANFEFDQIFVS
jgi:NDP-sugar pyrophosphorylase family protein